MREIADILSVNFFDLEHEIINFFNELQIEINFNKLSIDKSGFMNAVKNCNMDRLNNNPRVLNQEDLHKIYYFNLNNRVVNDKNFKTYI